MDDLHVPRFSRVWLEVQCVQVVDLLKCEDAGEGQEKIEAKDDEVVHAHQYVDVTFPRDGCHYTKEVHYYHQAYFFHNQTKVL